MVFDYTTEAHNINPDYTPLTTAQLQKYIEPEPIALHFSTDLQHGEPIDEPLTRGIIYVTQPTLV